MTLLPSIFTVPLLGEDTPVSVSGLPSWSVSFASSVAALIVTAVLAVVTKPESAFATGAWLALPAEPCS